MNIIGHKKIISLLEKAIAKKAVGQAYLFCGPEKVGKFTVALEFANKIIGSKEKITPDLIIVKPEVEEKKGIIKKRDIKIEQIRDLQHQLSLTANSSSFKVAIIDEAERLNKTAQNALLKTLEEANERVVLILVASDEKKLLPTILSRCQKIKFGIVSDAELSASLGHLVSFDHNDRKTPSVQNYEEIIFWSLGRPGLMLDFLENHEIFSARKEAEAEIKKMFSDTIIEKFALAEKMSKDVVSAAEKLNLWTVILRKNILENKNSLKSLRLIDHIEKSLILLKDTNSNARLVLENLLLQF